MVICDAHRVFADALASLLQAAGHHVTGSAMNLDDAARILAAGPADACVVDLRPPRSGRRPDIQRLVQSAPDTAFIALSASADAATLRHATASGVQGLALKGDDFGEFLRVVTEAAASQNSQRARHAQLRRPRPQSQAETQTETETGAQTGAQTATQVILSRSARAALRRGNGLAAGPSQFLTKREWETLVRLVRGESTVAMARAMGVRVSTARTHIDAVLCKLGAHSRLEAVAYAVREGLVEASGWLPEQHAAGL